MKKIFKNQNQVKFFQKNYLKKLLAEIDFKNKPKSKKSSELKVRKSFPEKLIFPKNPPQAPEQVKPPENKKKQLQKEPQVVPVSELKKMDTDSKLTAKKKSLFQEYSYQEDKNSENRKNMEDFHKIAIDLVKKNNVSLFSIFDGHGGDKAAIFCKDYFADVISKCISATQFNMPKALQFAFGKVDTDLLKKLKDEDEVGSTATTALIFYENNKKMIACANVGDSKCFVLNKTKEPLMLTKDHNCGDELEVKRIKEKGGLVFNGRVFGSLMVTRSIGDKEMKKYGVSCEPTITKHEIEEDDIYMVLASDGLWDCVDPETLDKFGKEDMTAEAMCKRLVMKGLEGSRDNISCIVVKL